MQYLVKPFEHADLAERLRRVADALGVLGADGEADQAADRPRLRRRAAVAPRAPPRARLPKGLSPETADLVLAALREHARGVRVRAPATSSASPASPRAATSSTSSTPARPRCGCSYGTAGRPQRRYRTP